MTLLSHPTVNTFVRALAEALDRDGRLAAFHTTIALGRRSVDVDRARLVQHPVRELARLASLRLGLRPDPRGPLGVDAVYRALDAAVARRLGGAKVVHCYEDGALATFRAARERGVRRIYELPIAHWRTVHALLREEAERLPAWAPTLVAPDDPPEKLARKDEELALAELVVCPSRFVQASLPAGTRSVVAEFGSPPVPPERRAERTGPLRLLFAGQMSQRKGLADVFAALRLLGRGDIEFIVLGALLAPLDFYRREWPHFTHEPPRPHAAVLALMDTCDALVLPSIVEGRALVQQEALSRGLPLIVTANAGGEDLITPGETGWLVPIRDPAALAERIAWLADHRADLPAMRDAARRRASERTWADYARKICAATDTML